MTYSKYAIIALAVLVLPLVGCTIQNQGKPSVTVRLPKAPAYYEACFNKLTDLPRQKLTRERVVILIAELRKSEKAKSKCGRDLLVWYDTVRTAFAKQT